MHICAEEAQKVRAIKELAIYLNKKLAEPHLEFYLKRLAKIPAGFIRRFCFDKMNELAPGMPAKFPPVAQFEEVYRNVAAAQKASASDYHRTPCGDCFGDGLLWYRIESPYSPSGYYERVVKCANCTNCRQHGPLPQLHAMTRQQLLDRGWEVYPYR